jgi:SprT protein
LAHLITHIVFPYAKPHGSDWKRCMQVMGHIPYRTHNMDMSNVPVRRKQRYMLKCGCPEGHECSSVIRNRIARRTRTYTCRRCGQTLSL